jgi:hypothetical protein
MNDFMRHVACCTVVHRRAEMTTNRLGLVSVAALTALLGAALAGCDGATTVPMTMGDAGPMLMGDGGPIGGDGGPMGDAASTADGGPSLDCTCDVTSLCDEGCECDIACSVVVGDAPLGQEADVFDRAEIAIYHPSTQLGPIDHVRLADDALTTSPHVTLVDSPRAPVAALPRTLGADVDGDGRDESVLVTSSQVIVEDWDGTALTPRTVHGFPVAASYDVAAGDLNEDGAPDLVVSHQVGDEVTIEALALSESGAATVMGTITVPGASRHALAVGPAVVGGQGEIWLLRGATGTPRTIEALWLHRFRFISGVLTEDLAPASLRGECLVPDSADDEGMSLAHGNLDADADLETVVALYCSGGELFVWAEDPGHPAAYARALTFRDLSNEIVDRGAFRPFLALGRLESPLAARQVAVGTTSDQGSFDAPVPTGMVASLALQFGELVQRGGAVLENDRSYTGARGGSVLTGLAARDVNRDGTDELVVGASLISIEVPPVLGTPCFPSCELRQEGFVARVEDGSSSPTELFVEDTLSSELGLGLGLAIVAGDFDADGMRVRATGRVFRHTGQPFVNAVLQAAPTWMGRAGVVQNDESGTSFGTTTSMSTAESSTISATASVTVSAGVSFGVAEFSAGVTASVDFAATTSLEQSVSFGHEITVGADADLVIFRAVPYASYEYVVVSHPDAREIGTFMTIDVPGHMIETVLTLDAFRAEYGAQADAIIPPSLFAHTIGDPTTYPLPFDCTQAAIAARVGTGSISAVGASPSLVDVGNASSGGQSLSMSLGTQTGTSTEVGLSVEMSVGVGAGGVSVEASAGIGASWTHETTVGRDVTYTGSVGFLSEGYGVGTAYEWGICVFHYTDSAHGSFPVVSYVVDPA